MSDMIPGVSDFSETPDPTGTGGFEVRGCSVARPRCLFTDNLGKNCPKPSCVGELWCEDHKRGRDVAQDARFATLRKPRKLSANAIDAKAKRDIAGSFEPKKRGRPPGKPNKTPKPIPGLSTMWLTISDIRQAAHADFDAGNDTRAVELRTIANQLDRLFPPTPKETT